MIYLDHAATTAVHPEVVYAMLPYFSTRYGNPSGIYDFAEENRKKLNQVRAVIAKSIEASPNEIYFTSGGTESDNWALCGVAEKYRFRGNHIVTTSMEHHAVLNTCRFLEKHGFEVTYVSPGEDGLISVEKLERALRPETILVSVMFANNEMGAIQPIEKLAKVTRTRGILLHTDAVQAYMQVPISVQKLGIDLMSVSAHKFGGPKGIGFLYKRDGVLLEPLLHGGGQERKNRAGTENVPAIVGMGKAVEIMQKTMAARMEKESRLRDYFMEEIEKRCPFVRVNGSRVHRLPGNINLSFQFIEGESLLILLDLDGICASAGSACSTGEKGPSYVLQSMGVSEEVIRGTVRFTLGEENTKEELDVVLEKVMAYVKQLREVSEEYKALNP